MSAPPPPTDRDALELRKALALCAMQRLPVEDDWADDLAGWQMARVVQPLLATIADLRSRLAAAEGENERLWQDGETAKTELSRFVVSLQADLAAAETRAREAEARAERAEAALKQVGRQYITHRGDMTDAEALSAIECIVRQTVEWEA